MKLSSSPSRFATRHPAASACARRRETAFTMIEIALSLAIIAFALVAIIGVLPMGMNVQKENREETIINQDATYWMEALRGGARGLDDLTNYVAAIVINSTYYNAADMSVRPQGGAVSYVNPRLPVEFSVPSPSPYLTNGQRIVGLLSTPKYQIVDPTIILSNYVVAYVIALSGSAAEKYPQTNPSVQELAFKYRLIPEVITYVAHGPVSEAIPDHRYARLNHWLATNLQTNPFDLAAKSLMTNLHEVRLAFRWPLRPDGNVGNGRQSFRAMVGGQSTNWPDAGVLLHFVDARTYRQGPLP